MYLYMKIYKGIQSRDKMIEKQYCKKHMIEFWFRCRYCHIEKKIDEFIDENHSE
jgi:hypothetical protein